LLNGLKKLPSKDGKEGGAFTSAVEWCAQHNVDISLSHIHNVVIALEHGLDPADALEFENSPTDDMVVDVQNGENRSSSIAAVGNVASTTVASTLSEVDEELLALGDSRKNLTHQSSARNWEEGKALIKSEDDM
jgi:hypothetical protein